MAKRPVGFGGRSWRVETGIHLFDLGAAADGENIHTVSCEMDVVPPDGAGAEGAQAPDHGRGPLPIGCVARRQDGLGESNSSAPRGQLSADWCGQRVTQVSARHGAGRRLRPGWSDGVGARYRPSCIAMRRPTASGVDRRRQACG